MYQQGGTAVYIALDRLTIRGVFFENKTMPMNGEFKGGRQMNPDNTTYSELTVSQSTSVNETNITEAQLLFEMQTTLNFFGAGSMNDLF